MAHEIRVPRLGWSMEEGKFIGWLKKPGDDVREGDALFELESDKAVQQIESIDAGRLHIPDDAPAPDTVLPVGALLGYLLESNEAVPSPVQNAPDEPATRQDAPAPTTVADIQPETDAPVATPRAKRVAEEIGVDWTSLAGTGREGRIREADVRAAAINAGHSIEPAHGIPVSLSPRRRAIADRLRNSRDRTVPVTLTTIADATNLVALRQQFKAASAEVVPAMTDIVACLVSRVLRRHLGLAMTWSDDQRSLVPCASNGIGIAVNTDEGLVVPVIRNVADKGLLTVARESKALIDRARAGRLTANEMQGGVISITNLGAWGIDGFTPIINFPEISILGLGAIRRELMVLGDDRTAVRDRITLSLTFDHAAIDGVPAAAFLRDVAKALENAAAHLIET